MSESTKKKAVPPYVPYSTFYNFISGLGKSGIPSHIDKSTMTKMSGSGQSAMIAALKSLHLINDNLVPDEKLINIASDDMANYSTVLAEIIPETYSFLFDGSIQIENASATKAEEKFKDAGASGSTLTKCIAFFLAATKAADIKISTHIKAPKLASKPRKIKKKPAGQTDSPLDTVDADHKGMRKFTVELRDTEDGIIYFPEGLTAEQAGKAVKMATFILNNYYDIEEKK